MAQAVIAGGLLLGYCRGYTTIRGIECPIDIQLQTGGVLTASKLVADTALPHDTVSRALASGALFAGGMFTLFDDKKWVRWIALGTVASYIADVILPPHHHRQEEN